MAQKRIFLHIGIHKTATTTIQAGCTQNRAALLEAGWLYPETGTYLFGQHNVAWEMCEGHEQPWNQVNQWVQFHPDWGGMRELLAEIHSSPAPNIILSSEDFDGCQTDRIQRIREHFKDFDVEVIVYLREQASFLQSAWAQFVKSGYVVEPFEVFIDRMLASSDEVLRYFGAYDVFLQPWMDIFGAAHVHPKHFSRDAFKGHIFHDFLLECQLSDVERFDIPRSQNISPGYKTLEMARLMAKDITEMEKRGTITHFIERMGKAKQWDAGKLNLITLELHQRVRDRFAKSNQFLLDHFTDGDPFFGASFSEKPLSVFDKQSISGEEWEEIARSITTYFIQEHFVTMNLYDAWKR